MTDAAILQSLAETLLPGAGFFSGKVPFALNLDVNARIDHLSIAIDAGQPEFLNIGAIRFMDMAGQEIDRDGIVRSVTLSSIFGETTPDTVHKRVLDGAMVHSRQELKPTLTIDLNEPVDVSCLVICNRGDLNGCRSRFLTLTATCAGDLAYSYVNFGSARHMEELQSLLAACGNPPLPEVGALDAFTDEVRNRLRARIDANTFSWNPKRAAQLLPVLRRVERPSDFEITVAAHIVLSLLGKRTYLETSLLSPLQSVLNSDTSIERMMTEVNRILAVRGEPSRTLIIGKHRIQMSLLTMEKEKYLSALDEIFPLLESLGVKAMLCYGTLLGAVREGRFLPHDDDVDVLCIDGSQSREEALTRKQELIARLKQDGYIVWDSGENFHVYINEVGVDLFMSWQEGERLHLMMERFQYRHIDADIVGPAASVQLYDRTYPAPANPAAFLQERYGDGWTVSDPFHEWPWPLSRRKRITNPTALAAIEQRKKTFRKRIDRTCFVAWGQRVGSANDLLPKNSIPLVNRALDHGYDAIEFDIRVTADGVPVLAHDDHIVGPYGEIVVSKATWKEAETFCIGQAEGKDVFVPTLREAIEIAREKDILLDPRIALKDLYLVRECVDEAGYDRSRLQFCVYSKEEAEALLVLFPESVLLWKIGRPIEEVHSSELDEAADLGMDGVMLIWPLHDQDFSELMKALIARNLRVLFYLHGAWPKRPRPDNAAVSLENMVQAGVDYITTTASHLPLFKSLTGSIPSE